MRLPLLLLLAAAGLTGLTWLLPAASNAPDGRSAASLFGLAWLFPSSPKSPAGTLAAARQAPGALRSPRLEEADAPADTAHLGFFLRSVELGGPEGAVVGGGALSLSEEDRVALEGVSHYRLLPGIFPRGMRYHFDGLATVLQFNFSAGSVKFVARAFQSQAVRDFRKCIFFGTGTGPTLGFRPCVTNPAVNLLPIKGELWLTTDTSRWGQVDPGSLETLPGSVDVPSTVLNAHPACDPYSDECYVQYNCAVSMSPYTDQACIALLRPHSGGLVAEEVSRVTLPRRKLIQHSHSPCVTPRFVVSKLDAFTGRKPERSNAGLLVLLHQQSDNLWMVMDRRTNNSRILTSTASFINNHFFNCFEEDSTGDVIVDTVAVTENYLDNYFDYNLGRGQLNWTNIFYPAARCRVPLSGSVIACEPFFQDSGNLQPALDYPTFNPLFKMNPSYRFTYAIAAKSPASRWFDQLVKVDVRSRSVVQAWSSPGVYLTEADFVPRRRGRDSAWRRPGPAGDASAGSEDDGLLLSVLYNSSSDSGALALFDAGELRLLALLPMGFVVPFHAHGVVCESGARRCYTNP